MAVSNLFRKFLKYFATGGTAAIVDIGMFAALIELKLPVAPTTIISFCVAAAVNYILTSNFVFNEVTSSRRFILYFLVAIIGLFINFSITVCLTTIMLLPAILSKCIAIGVAFLINFFMNSRVVFRNPN